jgi:hypothetical protein
MQNVRVDQAEDLLTSLEKNYKAFVTTDRKPYLSADDKAAQRHQLQDSVKQAQSAVETMDAQPGGVSADLRPLRSKLVTVSEMAAIDLKGPTPR